MIMDEFYFMIEKTVVEHNYKEIQIYKFFCFGFFFFFFFFVYMFITKIKHFYIRKKIICKDDFIDNFYTLLITYDFYFTRTNIKRHIYILESSKKFQIQPLVFII
jgi:hypothetical protein